MFFVWIDWVELLVQKSVFVVLLIHSRAASFCKFFLKRRFLPSPTFYFFRILVYWKGPKVIGLWKEGCFGSNFKWAVKFALMLSFILVTKSIYTRLRLKIYLYDLVLPVIPLKFLIIVRLKWSNNFWNINHLRAKKNGF